MEIKDLVSLLNGTLVSCLENQHKQVQYAFASDLMSDVLTVNHENLLLITGLVNIQVIRTAEMSDISCLVIARGKQVPQAMIDLANDTGITIITTSFSLFKASGLLFEAGILPVY